MFVLANRFRNVFEKIYRSKDRSRTRNDARRKKTDAVDKFETS